MALKESQLLDSIGTAQMEQEIQKKVLKLAKEQERTLEEQTGVEIHEWQQEQAEHENIQEYMAEVFAETLACAQMSTSWKIFPSSKNRLDGSGRRLLHRGNIRYQRRWQNTYVYRNVQMEIFLLEALAIEGLESPSHSGLLCPYYLYYPI